MVTNYLRITERCSCGATFDAGPYVIVNSAERAVAAFRRDHRHEMPVPPPEAPIASPEPAQPAHDPEETDAPHEEG